MQTVSIAVALLLSAAQCVLTSLPLVTRGEWEAFPPKTTPTNMTLPVPFVVIHHSYIPSACITRGTCCRAMKTMQHMHQAVNGWNDIGYNFAVGSDGSLYEGRGWDVVGAHAPKYNFMSIGICFIGDYRTELPSANMLQAARQLILTGVDRGSIAANYTMVGHSQVRETECPGGALLQEIQTWEHWRPVRDIQPRRSHAGNTTGPSGTAGSNTTEPSAKDKLADSNTTGPSVDDKLADSNTTGPRVVVNLADSDGNTTEPSAKDKLADGNTIMPSVEDNLIDLDGNTTELGVTADSNNDITIPDSNITVLNIT